MEPERPDPEQLLKQVKEESKTRGKLKIFFGACAGAGKTYAMLSAAQEKYNDKEDVVIGIVETHGRQETARLLSGLPKIPLRETIYQGITIKEMDIDGAINREPAILLVDELAHTNAIGSRHPKRWQDVQELLEHGIDVYTTLNVQHLESLNDMVANLTGIRVKETVPDSIFDNADEIVLVDIPSEVILERLNEGKVYLGEFAKQRAAQHFFKIENLIALREIALRRTAERVDALRDVYHKYQTRKHAISDKILVCIGPGPSSTKLVRTAKQISTKLKAPWTVIHIENDQHFKLAKEEQDQIKRSLQLAEQLGAKTETIQSIQTASAITDYATANSITKIITGITSKPSWKRWFSRSLAHDIIDKSGNIDVYVITEDTTQYKLKRQSTTTAHWRSVVYTLVIMMICTFIGLPAREWIAPQNVGMIYLAGVGIISAGSEQRASLLAALLSVIFYNFFFVYPYYNFYSYHFVDVMTLLILLLTSLVISSQMSRLRQHYISAKQREKFTSDLYALSRKLVETTGKHKIAKVASHHIGELFDCAATIWLADVHGHLEQVSHPMVVPDIKEESVAQWVYKQNQIAGVGTNTMPSARGYYIPLSTQDTCFGVLGIIPKQADKKFSSEETMLLKSLAVQTASALQRAKGSEQIQSAALKA